jgi:hypothetical protein
MTYQRTVPIDSQVFEIVSCGKVRELVEALEQGTARLTDRDEEGRSLLNVSFHEIRFERCLTVRI